MTSDGGSFAWKFNKFPYIQQFYVIYQFRFICLDNALACNAKPTQKKNVTSNQRTMPSLSGFKTSTKIFSKNGIFPFFFFKETCFVFFISKCQICHQEKHFFWKKNTFSWNSIKSFVEQHFWEVLYNTHMNRWE